MSQYAKSKQISTNLVPFRCSLIYISYSKAKQMLLDA